MATAKSAGVGELEFTSALNTAGCSCLLSPTHEAMIPLVIQDEFIIKGVLRCPLSLLPNSHTIGCSRYSLPAWIGTFSGMLWKVFTRIASGSSLSDNGFRASAPVADTPATPTETVCLSYLLYLCYLCLQAIYLQAHSANAQRPTAGASLRTLTAIKH